MEELRQVRELLVRGRSASQQLRGLSRCEQDTMLADRGELLVAQCGALALSCYESDLNADLKSALEVMRSAVESAERYLRQVRDDLAQIDAISEVISLIA